MDRLRTMSVFVSVAEQSGFAAAARQLNMSPPSVTRAISGLENRLGARLFHRTTRSVTLTESGERYLADCRRILNEIEEADRQATEQIRPLQPPAAKALMAACSDQTSRPGPLSRLKAPTVIQYPVFPQHTAWNV